MLLQTPFLVEAQTDLGSHTSAGRVRQARVRAPGCSPHLSPPEPEDTLGPSQPLSMCGSTK